MDPVIASDLYRYAGKADVPTFLRCLLLSPGFRFTYFLRKGSRQRRYSPAWFFYKYWHQKFFVRFGFQIPLTTSIGRGLFLGHFGNVVVNMHARIGDNCNIGPGVTIGQTNRGKLKGSPTIGNRVWIGPGAVIVGKVVIGDNVLIAPLAYVNVDVPANSIVMGNPAKIVPRADATAGYVERIREEAGGAAAAS